MISNDIRPWSEVLIVGAGISGITAAFRLAERNPGLSYQILERRTAIGGTWDLFRYPGIRSDSDIYTLSFPWEPWRRPESVAHGRHIQDYLVCAAEKHGITQNIVFGTSVLSADWDSSSDSWSVTVENSDGSAATTVRSRYLYFATGYYDYDRPYTPEWPGIDKFAGSVVHPQHWPADLDYTGKRLVVIGSGATAISMIPALTDKADSVVMLQRSPGYVLSQRELDPVDTAIRKLLPPMAAHRLIRAIKVVLALGVFYVSRWAPKTVRRQIRRRTIGKLPSGYDVDTHFNPRYMPWDQRLCVTLSDDLFQTVTAGRTEIVTGHIDHVDAGGVVLGSGERIDADVLVTATGLRLQALGGVALSIDGVPLAPHDRWAYKGFLLDDVPNLAWCIGYVNASWTLRADLTARAFAELVQHMRGRGFTHAYPHAAAKDMAEKLTLDLQSGYVQRSPDVLPKSSVRRPWQVRHNFLADLIDHRFNRIEEHMVFGRRAVSADRVQAADQIVN